MNLVNVIRLSLNLAIQKYGASDSDISDAEIKTSKDIFSVIEHLFFREDLEEEISLDFQNLHCNYSYQDVSDISSEDSCSECETDEQTKQVSNSFDLHTMKKIVTFYDTRKSKKFAQTRKRYPKVSHYNYITRFRNYISNRGTCAQMYNLIKTAVFEKFSHARQLNLPVHDIDLKRWASMKAKELGFNKFKCSDNFILSFKKYFGIVSRKVTKFSSILQTQNVEYNENSAIEFILQTRDLLLTGYNESQILNADQSGFNYFITNDRTLTSKGENTTTCTLTSDFSRTHSYTIMPTLSMSGELRGKMLICLREVTGTFGPVVKKYMFNAPNLYITCSKSGKMDKRTMKEWVHNCVKPILNPPSVILLDSWTGFTDPNIYAEIPVNCQRLRIPKNTTSLIQPLDVYFFRQYKIFVKQITNRILVGEMNIQITSRNEIIKMHSLVYNQLQSDAYQPMLKYPWFKCQYMDTDPRPFTNVLETSFNVKDIVCKVDQCTDISFVECAHCHDILCFHHFYVLYHYH